MRLKPTDARSTKRVRYLAKDTQNHDHFEPPLMGDEDRFRSIVEHSNELFYVHDTRHRLNYVSPQCQRILGYSPSEMMRKWTELTTENPINLKGIEITNRAIESGETQAPYLLELRKKDGGVALLEIEESPIKDSTGKVVGITGAARDVTERVRAEAALRESEERYRELADSLPLVVYEMDGEGRLTFANRLAFGLFGYSREDFDRGLKALEMLVPEDGEDAWKSVQRVMGGEQLGGIEYTAKKRDGSTFPVLIYATPILRDGRPMGIRGILEDITERKQAEDELRKTFAKLGKLTHAAIQAMAQTVEVRDPCTAGHQRRTTALATAIAIELRLPDELLEAIRTAGAIHDIGKLCVPAQILSKPARLTEVEFALVRTHPQLGYDIFKEIEFPWDVGTIVLQHHERMDGSGYPRGLKGSDILFEARILAVADVVEAMASHRPYRPALGLDKALDELSTQRGVLYDPDVVDCCLKLFQEKGFQFD